MHPKVFLSLCVGVCYLHFKKCGKHKKFNHKFQQFCLQPALDKLPFSFPSIKCRNTMRIRFFLHFQSSRHSSMVSKVACYWVGPRFKSRQGMIYPKISMMNGMFELLHCCYSLIWWIYIVGCQGVTQLGGLVPVL